MYQEWFKEYEKIKKTNKLINPTKKRIKFVDKLIKFCSENNLELIKEEDGTLIIKGIFDNLEVE